MTVLDYLRLWTGGFVRVEITADGVPTSFNARGELLNDDDEPQGLGGWFVVVRTPEMRVPGIGSLELRLDRYQRSETHDGDDEPISLVFSTSPHVILTIEPAVEDPG